ncbi:MAG TPA: SpoIIE family protein phosphatase, partial [Anaerolineaceae bacterium]|nr:SpoIIE family protein phosphatase [Anaerolineaceae bacterium]
ISGRSGALRMRDEEGDHIVTAYAPVPGTPWGLVTEEEWGALTADTRRYGQILLVLLGLGMVLPALGVSLMVRQRNREALASERIEQELQVARIIQKTLLPKDIPQHPGWEIAVLWQPARAVSGDFYDFIIFPENRLAFVIADVTDKGVPAGLVMASARSIMRGVSERLRSPAEILERTNNLLTNDIPHNMFVTALYAELDLDTGALWYANAGQNLPYRKCNGQVTQLEATGLPLGLIPNIEYDEFETVIQPGEMLLLFSDGLVEAHNSRQEMFGNRRLAGLLKEQPNEHMTAAELIEVVAASLQTFTSADWEQEDDVTLVAMRRLPPAGVETNDGERR